MKSTFRQLRCSSQAGISLVELIIAMAILAIVLSAVIGGLLVVNRNATANRTMTAARLIVERNIERALSVSYDLANIPSILATTSPSGVVWDDDGGGDNQVEILVQNASGTTSHLKGTLRRIVRMETTPNGAPVRRVTFRLNYDYLGRPFETEMTTLRAVDDF